jgi:diadenosine tetraphosphate (Ap4A) HIT family hydrolase
MKGMNNCEICAILATHNDGKDVQVIETEKWRVVLDPNQQFIGKAFVTLLEHKASLSDLDTEDWKDFEALVKRLESALKKAFQPNHFNWSCLMNIAAMNGQETHVHWHIHPRYDKPITIAGETFEDTQWYPRKERTDHIVGITVLQKIAEKIKENL